MQKIRLYISEEEYQELKQILREVKNDYTDFGQQPPETLISLLEQVESIEGFNYV